MNGQISNLEQLFPSPSKSKRDRPLPLYRPHLESKASVMTTTSQAFSIQSATPQTEKKYHTMTNELQNMNTMQPFGKYADIEKQDCELRNRLASDSFVDLRTSQLKLQSLINIGKLEDTPSTKIISNNTLQKQGGKRTADASTQVFTQNLRGVVIQQSNYILTSEEVCDFIGCNQVASAGKCDYRVCCSRGCTRNLCQLHLSKSATQQLHQQELSSDNYTPAIETEYDQTAANSFSNHVCIECETRANRAFWLTVFFIIIVPVMAALPAIIRYGGEQ